MLHQLVLHETRVFPVTSLSLVHYLLASGPIDIL